MRVSGGRGLAAVVVMAVLGAVLGVQERSIEPAAAAAVGSCDVVAWAGRDGGTNEIFVGDADGTAFMSISDADDGTDPTDNVAPSWSPDGERIAWAGRVGGQFEIFTAAADGSDRQQISNQSGPALLGSLNPRWSPTGDQVAWLVFDGESRLVVAAADGSDASVVSGALTGVQAFDWSPDGFHLALAARNGGDLHIHVMDADGGNLQTISSFADGPVDNEDPRWAPDQSRIVWSGEAADGDRHVFAADPGGTDVVEVSGVSDRSDLNVAPVFSPDSTRIMWAAEASGFWTIEEARADGTFQGRRSTWFSTFFTAEPGPLGFSPDGGRMTTGVANEELDSDGVVVSGASYANGTTNRSGVTWRPGPTLASIEFEAGEVNQISGTIATVTVTADCTTSATVTGLAPACGRVLSSGFSPVVPGEPIVNPVTEDGGWEIGVFRGTISREITVLGSRQGACNTQVRAASAADGDSVSTPGFIACPSTPTPINDLSPTSFALFDVVCIYNLEITTGTSDTTYSPAGRVTREQMAAFLGRMWRVLGADCDTSPTPLVDVPESSFAFDDVRCIYHLGITTGTSATTYSPGADVSREQMASFLARLWRAAVAADLATN